MAAPALAGGAGVHGLQGWVQPEALLQVQVSPINCSLVTPLPAPLPFSPPATVTPVRDEAPAANARGSRPGGTLPPLVQAQVFAVALYVSFQVSLSGSRQLPLPTVRLPRQKALVAPWFPPKSTSVLFGPK